LGAPDINAEVTDGGLEAGDDLDDPACNRRGSGAACQQVLRANQLRRLGQDRGAPLCYQ
jgi:hypothetical protein